MSKATGPVYNVPFRRRKKCLTNYSRRLALLKSRLPRMIIRKSNRGLVVQIVNFTECDKTEASAYSKELEKHGWFPQSNLPTAYLTGFLCAKRAIKKKITKAVLDTGLMNPTKASVPFAALKGAVDAGLEIPHSESMFDNDRFSGKHIAEYANKIKGTEAYSKQFSAYAKKGIAPENMVTIFESVKSKLQKE